MAITLFAKNFKALRDARLTVEPGLSALVGPNGAGKTTLLQLGSVLATAAGPDGPAAGIERHVGIRDLKHLDASKEEPIVIGFEDDQGYRWSFEPAPAGNGLSPYPAETLRVPDEVAFKDINGFKTGGGETAFAWGNTLINRDDRSALRQLFDRDPLSQDIVATLIERLEGYRLYMDYGLSRLRLNGSPGSGRVHLSQDGGNAFSVLRNWRDKSAMRPRWDLVLTGLRECFDWFDGLDFESTAQIVSAQLVLRGRNNQTVSVASAANGWFVAMLHLCAVASADDGQTVAIDEFEDALHPFAINRLLDILDDYLRGRSISVLLSTHSPTVLDWFEARPDRVLVLPGDGTSPRRLTDLRDREWLTHFRLGQLFQTEGFAGA